MRQTLVESDSRSNPTAVTSGHRLPDLFVPPFARWAEWEEHVGFQAGDGGPDFWVSRRGGPAGTGTHVCFRARGRETVEAFHTAALAAGGTDNGPPGLRPHYHEHYYGAYVFDPDGNNVEAVCHAPAPA